MEAIRRILQDIRTGQNIDIYITVLLSILVAILSLIYPANQSLVPAAILAILALVSNSLLTGRRANQDIENALRVLQSSIGAPVIFLKERRFLIETYTEKSRYAEQIDSISLTMASLLDGYGDDLIERAFEGKKLRILLLSPTSPAAAMRGRDEGIDLPAKTIAQIERLQTLYEKALKLKNRRKCRGSLEVRFYDDIPYFAYFATENEMIIGLYYSHLTGMESEAIHIRDVHNPIYQKMRNHFERLWEGPGKKGVQIEERIVCRVSSSDCRFINLSNLKVASD